MLVSMELRSCSLNIFQRLSDVAVSYCDVMFSVILIISFFMLTQFALLYFNLRHINWSTPSTSPGKPDIKSHEQLLDIMNDHSLEQMVTKPTRGDRLKSPPRMTADFEFLLILSSDVFSWSSAYPVSFGDL
jgi:hypothetical protein